MVAPFKVGIAGLGTVGVEVVRLIEQQSKTLQARSGREIEVVAVTARSKGKKRGVDLSGMRWAKTPLDVASDPEIDCFVELMGGAGEPALSAIEAALKAGKSVVTANKALIAKHGLKLGALAEKHSATLHYEAGVAGAVPVIKTLREGLSGTTVNRVYGILNGTCNYILTRMELEGLSFADCLADAQRLGYAEADPTFDVEGFDTAQKLTILASLAFGIKIAESAVYVEGISSIESADLRAAQELGYRVKLLGVATRTANGIEQRVHPTMVPRNSSIAQVMGVTNAVTIDGEGFAPITLVGPGAGGAATASAVLADIVDAARGGNVAPFGRPTASLAPTSKAPVEHHQGGYYIRLMARDLPGTTAAIATRLADEKISIASIVQRKPDDEDEQAAGGRKKGALVPVILVTHATSEDAVRRALKAVQADKVISGRPQVIRIEKN